MSDYIRRTFVAIVAAGLSISAGAVTADDDFSILINNGWTFSLGNAASMEADYTHGTEYFTYLCKVKSTGQSKSPIMPDFDDSGWQRISLPHDWAVDLPYSAEASHSHGYKCIGWRYPENSVGWYRRHIHIPAEDRGRQISIEFEGIFRDSEVFCNGFYLGHEVSGYVSKNYVLTPYLNYGGDNVITVRCDASTEEGWYYEGAGIYRNVRIRKAGKVGIRPYSLKIVQKSSGADAAAEVWVDSTSVDMEYVYADAGADPSLCTRRIAILDADGNRVDKATRRWSVADPYLYTLEVSLFYDGKLSARQSCRFGVRTAEFSPERGFLLNGEPLKLKGCNLHLDHAGVGTGVPDALWRYRLGRLREYGFNAVRCSHNCASPAMLDLCDEMGILVIDENRQLGVNEEQLSQLRNMIERDRNHPCVILWSIGNEEWAVEGDGIGREIALRMSEYVHDLDPSRPSTYGNSGGPELVKGVDVLGYNYIVQNPIDDYHELLPERCALGTEETSGCGTRGHYETVPEKGWMTPLNRVDTLGRINVIEHGWKYYKQYPWRIGLFYWTGQDYRGEPNPMKWPATGSQFGILDYCCFPKDEAFYLKSVWTDEPVVHICGPYDGEVWVYSNCDEVRLYSGGRSLGKKTMPQDGHLVWEAGDGHTFRAAGYRGGRKVAEDCYPQSTGELRIETSAESLLSDGQDVVVIDVYSGEELLDVAVENAVFLGWGNGDPGFAEMERPSACRYSGDPLPVNGYVSDNAMTIRTFSGCAQILVRSVEGSRGEASVRIGDKTVVLPIRNR